MYENFYHLRAKPFRLSPDPSFFFASRGHKRALAYLRYGLSQSEGFVVITGAPGTGKTTLAQILLKEMGQSDVVVAHLTTTQLEADEMLRMVLASFGLRYEGQDKAGLLKTLEAFFMARSRENKRVLLVVDEAQNLPARSLEELRMLSNLQVGDKALLQTFLLGQVQFRQMLDHPDLEQLRQRVIANYHLSALGEDECQSYVETRMERVGWEGDPKFSDEAFEIIFKYTEGIPRRINMLCDRVLLFSSLEEQHTIDAKVLQDVTDELQSEISGKPIARPEKIKSEKPSKSSEAASGIVSAKDVEEKPTRPDVSSQQETAPTDFAESSDAVGTTFEENGGMDRAVPDDGWTRHVAQAQPDEIETDIDHGADSNEPAEMERFRVIASSKEAAEPFPAGASDRPANQPSPDVMAPLPDAPGDTQEVVLRKILRLVLAFHRSPRSFPGLDDPSQPLPKGITAILDLAIADDHVLSGLRQIAVMGISPSMLRSAVRFFVRRVLFLPGGDDYRVLGLSSNATLTDVEAHYGLLMKLLRQDKKSNDESGVLRVGEAYERLCRSEITSPTEERTETRNEQDSVEEGLDLDLSPNVGRGANSGLRPAPAEVGEIVTSDDRTGPTARNMMLIAGAAVIVFILYLTQIKTSGDLSPELAVDSPSEEVVALNPVDQENAVVEKLGTTTEIKKDVMTAETSVPAQLPTGSIDSTVEKVVTETTVDATAQAEADARAKAIAIAQAEEAAKAKAKADEAAAQAALKAAAAAKLKREAEIKAIAEAKIKAEAEAKAAADAKRKAAAKARAEAQAKARAKAEAEAAARAKAEAQAKADAKAKLEAEAKAKLEAKVKAAAIAKATANQVTTAGLKEMLATFASAYQAGDMNALLKLHSPIVRTNKSIDVAGVRNEYQSLFKKSSERSVQFKDMSWEQNTSYARGRGKYTISVVGSGDQPGYEESGDVTMQVENRSGKLQIIRYYTSNAVTVERVGTSSQTVASANTNPFSRIPTKDLDGLINNLIQTYAAGDIDAFMALFAKDAQTNDRATVKGIRDDYVGLFANTSFRAIAFKGLQWKWDGRIARAEGRYDVDVQPNGQSQRDHYTGQVWIQIERRDGGVRITHFAFSE